MITPTTGQLEKPGGTAGGVTQTGGTAEGVATHRLLEDSEEEPF